MNRDSLVAVHGSVVAASELSFSAACRILVPSPGIKLMSPALQGGFLTTGPPGKSLYWRILMFFIYHRKTKDNFIILLHTAVTGRAICI